MAIVVVPKNKQNSDDIGYNGCAHHHADQRFYPDYGNAQCLEHDCPHALHVAMSAIA
ncbi:hypothetical protein [Methylotenera sp.]|uniref:hypothetical protein n=1 Tax=Methylotenera sp. TaxID=2051956 RepID=UPI0025D5CD59|nr:hypothetical protein [Methylotenera sp.]